MKQKGWKIKEKVVAIIESYIDKEARVSHDLNLPVIGSPSNRKRQCDVVIVQGKEPRTTMSIIEVQKRKSKPNINDFNGWLEKKEEVGAQHLICVSEKGFSNSIKEKADLVGPSVRLLTLKELEQKHWPIPPSTFLTEFKKVRYDELKGLKIHYHHLVRQDPKKDKTKQPNPHEKFFRTPKGDLISTTDFMDYQLFSKPDNIDQLPIQNNIPLKVDNKWSNNDGLDHLTDFGEWKKVKRLEIFFELSISKEKINWTASNYEQLGWGELGWVLRGESDDADIIIPLKKVKLGQYEMGTPINLSDSDAFISLGNMGYKVLPFSEITKHNKQPPNGL